ncbi:MAG: hypothetical protein V7636_2612 [Actinomycetota bacterium]
MTSVACSSSVKLHRLAEQLELAPPLGALYLLTLASALPLGALIASANPPDGGCSGIGFGCSLYGWDAAGFALLFAGVPYAVILAALLGVLCLLPRRCAGVAQVVAALGLAVPWFAVLALGNA